MEFTTSVQSLLPFFSLLPSAALPRKGSLGTKPHASETFAYLSAVSREILSLPVICQEALRLTLVPRMVEEWKGWLKWVDVYINNESGMYGLGMLKDWEGELDEFAGIPMAASLGLGMREIRDGWVHAVGRLVGRVCG